MNRKNNNMTAEGASRPQRLLSLLLVTVLMVQMLSLQSAAFAENSEPPLFTIISNLSLLNGESSDEMKIYVPGFELYKQSNESGSYIYQLTPNSKENWPAQRSEERISIQNYGTSSTEGSHKLSKIIFAGATFDLPPEDSEGYDQEYFDMQIFPSKEVIPPQAPGQTCTCTHFPGYEAYNDPTYEDCTLIPAEITWDPSITASSRGEMRITFPQYSLFYCVL